MRSTDSKEIEFSKYASKYLIQHLKEKILNITIFDLDKSVFQDIDASSVYGNGWLYRLSVKWQPMYDCFWMQLNVYKDTCPYKSSTLLFTGTQQEIINKVVEDASFVADIEDSIPRLHYNLVDIQNQYS